MRGYALVALFLLCIKFLICNAFHKFSLSNRLPSLVIKANSRPLDSTPLELCEENAQLVIEEVRRELGTIFGYDKASRDVGITGFIII